MAVFSLLVGSGSFTAAARELGVSTAAVSKRLANLEARLGVTLLNRTTRRIGLTAEGEIYLTHARRILGDIDNMEQLVASSHALPRGLVRVNATLGFGRTHVAPLIAGFAKRYPDVEVQLQLTVNPPALTEDSFDVGVRFGPPPDARVLARHLAPNRRLLCASPAYLARSGIPQVPQDLARHNCIGIRQGDEAYGIWHLSQGKRVETVRVRGQLSSNDGEIAVNWALAGHGIVMRAEWDVAKYLKSGRLRQVLAAYATPNADIHAVVPQRHRDTARVQAFVDHLQAGFATPPSAGEVRAKAKP
jgi:LysR family transcriptional regulator, transcriptional activator for dmlA